jgi:hypothetical protein
MNNSSIPQEEEEETKKKGKKCTRLKGQVSVTVLGDIARHV